MKRFFFLLFFSLLFFFSSSGQTMVTVDLTASPNISKTYSGHRSGSYCGDNNCIVFDITLNSGSDFLNFTADQITGASFYTVNCGPLTPIGTPACISGLTHAIISFCKPGANVVNYTITASTNVKASDDFTVRQGCSGTMSVTGLDASSVVWTSVYPGATGAYDQYLSCATGCATTTVTPDANAPAYIDYKVYGNVSACQNLRSDVVRVYTVPQMTVSVSPSSAVICNGASVVLTATPTGGNPPYAYSWSNGATTQSITVSAGGTYNVSVSDNTANCAPVGASATVTAAATPAAPMAAGTSICAGNSTVLTATAPGGTYQWYDAATGGNLLYTGDSFATPVLNNSTTYYTDATISGCTGPRTAVTVTVNPVPAAPTVSGTTICSGSVAALNATAPGGTYRWYDAVTGGNLLYTGSGFTTPPLTSTTTYYIDATSAAGCTGARSAVTVTVNPTPANPTAAGTTICSGNVATLTATNPGGTYEWYDAATGGNLLFSGPSFTTPALTGSITYYVQTIVNGCSSARTPVTVNVNAIPAPPTASGAAVCAGNSTVLTATAPGGIYQWYDAVSGGNLLYTGDSFATPALIASTTYYVQTTVNGCISPRTAVTVTVNTVPSAPAVSGTTICSGNVATLTATAPGGTYNWYDAATGGNLLYTGSTFITPPLSSTTTYYADATSAAGCTGVRSAATVTVNPTPANPTAAGTTICSGDVATLMATSPGGSYEWYDAATGGNLLISGPSFTTPSLTSTTTYYVQTVVNGCLSGRTPVTVTVNAIPAAPTASGAVVCAGSSTVLTATAPGGIYRWYDAASGGNLLYTGDSFATPALTASITYYVQTTVNSCTSQRTAVTVTVNPIPAMPTVSGTTICSGSVATLNAAAPGGTYHWYDAATGGNLLGTGSAFTTPALSSGTTYYVDATSAAGCTGPRSAVTVIVNAIPAAPTASDASVCYGSVATLTATAPGGTYQWYDAPAGGNLLATGVNYTTATLTASAVYYVQTTVNGCVSARTVVKVTVNPLPAAPTVSGSTICQGDGATLTAAAPGGIYNWYNAATGGTLLYTGPAFTTPALNATTSYYVDATSAAGCTGPRTAVTVTVTPPVNPAFYYTSGTFCKTGSNPVPTIVSAPGGTFSSSAGLVFADIHTGEIDLAASMAGTYTIIFTTATSCAYQSSTIITITTTPDARFTYNSPFCEKQANPLPVFPAGASAGTFSCTDPALIFLNASTGEIDLQHSAPGTYTIVNTIPASGACPMVAERYTITINPAPAVVAGSDQIVCSGQSITLSGTIGGSAISATWSGGSGTFADASSLHTTYTPAAGETSVVLYLTTNDPGGPCGPAVDHLTVTIKPTPGITSAATATICNNTAQNYQITSDVSGAAFVWNRAAVSGISNAAISGQTGSTITETLINTTTSPVMVIYDITPTAGACPGNTFLYKVTVNPTTTVTSASTASICNNQPAGYQITGNVPGATFIWSRTAVPGISNAAVTGQTGAMINETLTNTTSQPVNVFYDILPQVNGCDGSSFQLQITVYPTPVINSAHSDILCSGSVNNYSITSNVSGATFTWSRAAVPGISNGAVSGQTGSIISESLINTTSQPINVTYNITAQINNCSGPVFQYILTVNPTPEVTSAATAEICNNSSPAYQITSNVAGAGFTWSRAVVSGISNPAVNGQTSSIINETLSNTTPMPVTVTYTIIPSASGCSGPSFTYRVIVYPSPVITSAANATVCNNTSNNYQITSNVAGTTFTWNRAAVVGISNTAVSGQTASLIGETLTNTTNSPVSVVYHITPSVNGCQGLSFDYTVTVNPTPRITSAATAVLCNNNTLNYMIGSNVAGTTFTWSRAAMAGISNAAVSGQNGNLITETLNNTTTAPVTVTYHIIPQANGCAGVPFDYQVTVNPTPAVTSAANGNSCNGTPLNYQLTSNVSGATFTWSRAATAGISNPAITLQSGSTINESLTNTSAAPVVVTYNINASANGCTGPLFQYHVTVAPTPVVTSPLNGTTCSAGQQSYEITSNVPGATYHWSRAAVGGITNAAVSGQTTGTISESLTNTTNQPVDVVYTITPDINGCAGPVFQYRLTVNPTPIVTSAATAEICNHSPQHYQITGNVAGASFTWSRAAVSGISNAAVSGQSTALISEILNNTTPNPVEVIYTITSAANGCEGPAFLYKVTVDPTVSVSNTSLAQSVCTGNATASVQLTSLTNGATFTWTAAATAGITGFVSSGTSATIPSQTILNTTTGTGRLTYTITPAYHGCPGTSVDYVITVYPATSRPVISSNSPVCQGSGVMLNTAAVAGATYQWTGPNGFTSSQQNPVINNVLATQQGTYTLLEMVNGCASPVATTTVIVIATPAAPLAASNSPVCAGSTLKLTAGTIAGAAYIWTGPDGFTSNEQNPTVNSPTTSASGVYSVRVIVNGCESPAASITVKVNAVPQAPTATSAARICAGSPLQLKGYSSEAGVSFRWTGPNGFTSTLQNPVINNAAPTNSGIYYVTVSNGYCESQPASVTVSVDQIPINPIVSSNSPVCIGSPILLSTTTYAGAAYHWTGPGGFISDEQNPVIDHADATAGGTYTVTINARGCTMITSRSTTLTVNPIPAPPAVNSNTPVCFGSMIRLYASGPQNGSYYWTGPNGFTSALQNPVIDHADTRAGGTYTVTVTVNSCTSAPASVNVLVPDPVTVSAGSDQQICAKDNAVLKGAISQALGGKWSTSGNGTFSPSNTSIEALYIPGDKDIAAGHVTLTLTSNPVGNCTGSADDMQLQIVPPPKIAPQPFAYVLKDEPLTLHPQVSGTDLKFEWSPNLFLNNNKLENPTITGEEDITYTLTVIGEGGCIAQEKFTIKVLKPVEVPNTFTPNGDGINDNWAIKNLEEYPDNVTVQVYNRYGINLFSSRGYGTPWDGNFRGKPVPAGVYYYVIDLKQYGKMLSGYITVIR